MRGFFKTRDSFVEEGGRRKRKNERPLTRTSLAPCSRSGILPFSLHLFFSIWQHCIANDGFFKNIIVAKMSLWWSMGPGSSSEAAPFNGQTDTSHASMFLEHCKAKPNLPRFCSSTTSNEPLPCDPNCRRNQHSVRFMAGHG